MGSPSATPESSDSLSTSPSPTEIPSPGTSVEKKTDRFRRTNKTKRENASDEIYETSKCFWFSRTRHYCRELPLSLSATRLKSRSRYLWRVKRRGSGRRTIESEWVCFLVSPFLITKIFTVHSVLRQYHCSGPIDGQLEEEKVQIYIRLGISMSYKGTISRTEGGRGPL